MTKLPRTFALRYIPCDCHKGIQWDDNAKPFVGCFNCQFTGYRTEHVPLADAILEVEEQNAALYLESVKQDTSPTVGKEHPFTCDKCGNIRNYKQGGSLLASLRPRLICSTCDCPTPHTSTAGKEPALLDELMRHIEPGVAQALLTNLSSVSSFYQPLSAPLQTLAERLSKLIDDRPRGDPALLPPHSARQSGAQVGDPPCSDAEKGAKGDAGPEKETTASCSECGGLRFTPVGGIGRYASFNSDGTLTYKAAYTFSCTFCKYVVGHLPLKSPK